MVAGYYLLRKRQKIVDMGVRFDWAEEALTMSSYTIIGILGIVILSASFLYIVGVGDNIIKPAFDTFKNMWQGAGRI